MLLVYTQPNYCNTISRVVHHMSGQSLVLDICCRDLAKQHSLLTHSGTGTVPVAALSQKCANVFLPAASSKLLTDFHISSHSQ